MSKIIGLIGPAGVGKSVAAAHLEQQGFLRLRFSGPMKAMMRAYFRECGLSEAEAERRIEGDLKEVPDELLGGKTPRYAMQTLGTDWGRMLIDEEWLSKAWLKRAQHEVAQGRSIVAEDVRFCTEQDAIEAAGGELIELSGRSKEQVVAGGHASEAMEGLSAQIRIVNDGTIEQLRENIDLMTSVVCEVQK